MVRKMKRKGFNEGGTKRIVVCRENEGGEQGGVYTNIRLEGLRFPTPHSLNDAGRGAIYCIGSSAGWTEGVTGGFQTKVRTGQRQEPATGWNRTICAKPKFGVKGE